jgi:hypothetical protein
VEQFRRIWQNNSDLILPIFYREMPHVYGQELIVCYPECFRSKTAIFDNLTISTIEVLFKRR